MILKSITLENIRSYRGATTVDFQLGTTLFEGDVASGKSTILSAVEFALFGLGDLNGAFLLRNGAESGAVTLEFDVEGREYRVHRSLVRKGDSVRSGDSFIYEGGEREKLATRELKERVLQLLKFNEPPNPKSQSVIYRYAIFTPQEAMREIIERDPGARLETLRKAYGIEQYKTAAQNTKTITTEFRLKINGIRGQVGNLDQDRKDLADLRSRIDALRVGLAEAKKRKDSIAQELEEKRGALAELEEQKAAVGRAQDKIPLLKRQLDEAEQQRTAELREIQSAERRIAALAIDAGRYESVANPTTSSEEELEREDRRLKEEVAESRDQVSKYTERLKNFTDLLEKGRCPICEREYEADRVGERRLHIEGELVQLKRKALELDGKEKEVSKTIDRLREYRQAQRDLKLTKARISDMKERMDEDAKRAKRLEESISELNEQFRQANKVSEPLKRILVEIEKAEDSIRDSEARYSAEVRGLGGIEKELETSQADIDRRAEQVKEKERLAKVQAALEEDRMWLSDYFAPTLEIIEEQSFANRNRRFNEQFQKWFQILVDDPDLHVRVKEDFSPVIERDGYEQEYGQLSGGERTSVALAYRLALNTTVQEAALGQEPNLLILDEPTDGFSKEQLAKFGDILTELKCPQVILVSHERELESIADRVYKIDKVNGESMVSVR